MSRKKEYSGGSKAKQPASAGLHKAAKAFESGDYATAFAEYTSLAELGNVEAQNNLGMMYANGMGIPQDYEQAELYIRRAAEAGFAAAQGNLGMMYAEGKGVPQDDAEAVKWLRRAAEAGNVAAQRNLEVKYANHEDAPQYNIDADLERGVDAYLTGDYATALVIFTPLAKAGFPIAQHNLGLMNFEGKGVPQDYEQAALWIRRAAEAGNATAQGTLGMLYEGGKGVEQDNCRAYMWYNLAIAQGDEEAKEWRDTIAKSMTSEQIVEAERMVEKCRAQNYRGC